MGRKKSRGRPVNGILLLDKTQGVTSNGALQSAKKIFAAAKAGHTGSLDPLATGLLPICFGEATKFSQYLLNADKTYRARIRLGIRTETGDADGDVVEETAVPPLDKTGLETVLGDFLGEIEQVPSMYSALKHEGQPLYKLARQGIEVERKPRRVTIHELKLLSFDNNELEVEVSCSKGTYIRTLAEDIGSRLGCGAHVTALRRLRVGPFSGPMKTLDELYAEKQDFLAEHEEKSAAYAALDRLLLPLSAMVTGWPRVEMTSHAAWFLKRGQAVQVPNAPLQGEVAIFEQTDLADAGESIFLGVGEITDDGKVGPRRLVATGV